MKLLKNIYTFIVGENKDISQVYSYQGDRNSNIYLFDDVSFDNREDENYDVKKEEQEIIQEEVNEEDEYEEGEYEEGEYEEGEYEEGEYEEGNSPQQVNTNYLLYTEESKGEFIEKFVKELIKNI
jgi:hypothetical protein